MNSIHKIEIYRAMGTWAFDDEARGIIREPLVCGMPEIIDKFIAAKLGKKVSRAVVTFSGKFFPDYQISLTWTQAEGGGNWYQAESYGKGWLCPTLLAFFDKPPEIIYVKIGEGVTV